jgi:hypothetical protein
VQADQTAARKQTFPYVVRCGINPAGGCYEPRITISTNEDGELGMWWGKRESI